MLDIDRNEPCFCGSGKKYKRCCLPNVEAAAARISRALEERYPGSFIPRGFVGLMAQAVGMAEDMDEIPLPLDTALRVSLRIADAYYGPEGPDERYLQRLHDVLLETVRSHPQLTSTRLDHLRLPGLLEEVLEHPDSIGGPSELPAGERAAVEVARRLWDPDVVQDWFLELLLTLRSPLEPEVLEAVAWGAWCLAEGWNRGVNLFGLVVFDVTLREAAEASAELRNLADGPPEDASPEEREAWSDRLRAAARKYPFVDRMLSETLLDKVSGALEAVRKGEIHFGMPAWAFVNTLRALRPDTLVDLCTTGRALSARERQALTDSFLNAAYADWEPVSTMAQAALEAYASRAASEPLRHAAKCLADHLSDFALAVQRLAYLTAHHVAFSELLEEDPLPTGLPEGNPFRLELTDVHDDVKLRVYADELERTGQKKAADHVRSALAPLVPEEQPGRSA